MRSHIKPCRRVDIRQCANEDIEPQTGVDCEIPHRLERGTSASEDAVPRRGVNCEIPYWLERGTKHSLQRSENLSLTYEGKPKEDNID